MNESSTPGVTEDEYHAIEQAFREEYLEGSNDNLQHKRVFDQLIPRIKQSAEAENLSKSDYESRLLNALHIVADIASALNSRPKEDSFIDIWWNPTLTSLQTWSDHWLEPSPVDKSLLDTATRLYLQRPWMQLNLLDWYILNGYIFDEVARLAEAIKSGRATGRTNWAYVFSEGNIEKTILWRLAFEILKFVARWLLIPAIVATLYYRGYERTAEWIAIPYGIYLLSYIALFPRRYSKRKALKKEYEMLEKNLHGLVNVFQSSSVEIFNPTQLRDLIANTERDEVFFRPAVYSILDRAIERDAAVFALENRP